MRLQTREWVTRLQVHDGTVAVFELRRRDSADADFRPDEHDDVSAGQAAYAATVDRTSGPALLRGYPLPDLAAAPPRAFAEAVAQLREAAGDGPLDVPPHVMALLNPPEPAAAPDQPAAGGAAPDPTHRPHGRLGGFEGHQLEALHNACQIFVLSHRDPGGPRYPEHLVELVQKQILRPEQLLPVDAAPTTPPPSGADALRRWIDRYGGYVLVRGVTPDADPDTPLIVSRPVPAGPFRVGVLTVGGDLQLEDNRARLESQLLRTTGRTLDQHGAPPARRP